MTTAEQRIAALEATVARLAEELEHVRYDACTLKTFEQWQAFRRFADTAAPRPPRPRRHLEVVQ